MNKSIAKTHDQAKAEGVALALMTFELAIRGALDDAPDPLKPGLERALQLTTALQSLPVAQQVLHNMRRTP